MAGKDNKIFWIIGIIIIGIFLLNNYQTQTDMIGIQIHYLKNGQEINTNKLFSLITPPGLEADQIYFTINGRSIGNIDLTNITIINASPIEFKISLPSTTQSLLKGETKPLWTTNPINLQPLESYPQPITFFLNISAYDNYYKKTTYVTISANFQVIPSLPFDNFEDGVINPQYWTTFATGCCFGGGICGNLNNRYLVEEVNYQPSSSSCVTGEPCNPIPSEGYIHTYNRNYAGTAGYNHRSYAGFRTTQNFKDGLSYRINFTLFSSSYLASQSRVLLTNEPFHFNLEYGCSEPADYVIGEVLVTKTENTPRTSYTLIINGTTTNPHITFFENGIKIKELDYTRDRMNLIFDTYTNGYYSTSGEIGLYDYSVHRIF